METHSGKQPLQLCNKCYNCNQYYIVEMKWLFLIYHLQTQKSRERVRVWRLIKKIGAVLYRNSVYVLPYSEERLEDFQWLCQQIKDSKGEGSIFVSESHDETESQFLLSLFERSREEEYVALLRSAEELLERIRVEKEKQKPSELLLKKFIRPNVICSVKFCI